MPTPAIKLRQGNCPVLPELRILQHQPQPGPAASASAMIEFAMTPAFEFQGFLYRESPSGSIHAVPLPDFTESAIFSSHFARIIQPVTAYRRSSLPIEPRPDSDSSPGFSNSSQRALALL